MRHRVVGSLLVGFALAPAVRSPPALQPARDGYEACTMGGRMAVSVVVEDSSTGAPLADHARLAWRAGASAGTGVHFPGRTLPGGLRMPAGNTLDIYGRPGVFTLAVQAPGYREWHRSGIRVQQGETHCSVRAPVTVRARLQRR